MPGNWDIPHFTRIGLSESRLERHISSVSSHTFNHGLSGRRKRDGPLVKYKDCPHCTEKPVGLYKLLYGLVGARFRSV